MRHARLLVPIVTVAAVASLTAQDRLPRVPGIDVSGMDLSVRAQDDFFRYVNGKWVDNTPIPGDQSSYGTFAILRDRAQDDVRTIIEAAAKSGAAAGTDTQKIGDLYKSFMDDARIESLGVTPLNGELARIAQIQDAHDLAAAFARAARLGVRTPVAVSVGAEIGRAHV